MHYLYVNTDRIFGENRASFFLITVRFPKHFFMETCPARRISTESQLLWFYLRNDRWREGQVTASSEKYIKIQIVNLVPTFNFQSFVIFLNQYSN